MQHAKLLRYFANACLQKEGVSWLGQSSFLCDSFYAFPYVYKYRVPVENNKMSLVLTSLTYFSTDSHRIKVQKSAPYTIV